MVNQAWWLSLGNDTYALRGYERIVFKKLRNKDRGTDK